MIRQEEVYKIGRLGKPHGFKGELSMQCDDDVFDRVDADYLVISIDGILVPFFIEEYRFRSDSIVLMKFEGIDSEAQARELTGCDVYFPHRLAEPSEEGPSWQQLQGYTVLNANNNGQAVGTVQHIDTSTVNTLLEVRGADGQQWLLPASPDLVTNVDTHARTVTLTIPDGLLSL